LIDPRLEAHDDNQLELKLSYMVEKDVKKQRYFVETYIFVPRTLGIGVQSYSPAAFLEDTQTFVRLKTPMVALEALAKAGRAERWFDPVRKELDRLLGANGRETEEVVRHLKLLGCIYRSAMRDEGHLLVQRFEALGRTSPELVDIQSRDLTRALEAFLDHMQHALVRVRNTGQRCEHAVIPTVVRDVWAAVDEYISVYAEETVTNLVHAADGILKRITDAAEREGHVLTKVRVALAELAVANYHYRRARGYPSFAVPGVSNEDLPRRRRILKRIVSSVLYLDSQQAEGGRVQKDIIAGVAAAIAMLFAALVAMWAQLEWGVFSGAFLSIAVLSYIIKDRLKDWGKSYLGKRLAGRVPDYVNEVKSPDGDDVIGECREWIQVTDRGSLDREIDDLRHIEHPSSVASHGRPEVVIRYCKEVILASDGLQRALVGVDGLNDIIRINFARLRQRMDNPIETYRIVHPTTFETMSVPCARVYHLNVVLRITRGRPGRSTSHLERVRVVLDQEGLKRVEPVGQHASGIDTDAVMGLAFEGATMVPWRVHEDHAGFGVRS